MKKFSIRTAEPQDAQNYMDWLKAAADINLVDTEVYSYPTCNTVVIEKGEEPVLMNSFHLVLVLEALAPKPGLSPKDEAIALRELYEGVRNLAAATGVREVYFACVDERLQKFIERKGFKRVHAPVYRMLLGREDDPLNKRRPEGHPQEEKNTSEAIQ